MPKLTFYRQKRFDGGIRMGVELERPFGGLGINVDHRLLEHFDQGEGERDPSLLWYVDIRCEGPGIPDDDTAAVRWLLATSPNILIGLERFADRLRRVGTDLDEFPLVWSEFPNEDGIQRRISCSTIRRIDARGLAEILDDIRLHWGDRIERMIAEHESVASQD